MSDKIQAENTPHRYFTMMLNMAEDDLDPFQYRLLAHYVRWTSDGQVFREGIRTTAKRCQMNERSVRKAREDLQDKGYLKIIPPAKKGQATSIMVLDRWGENVLRYSKDTTPKSVGCSINTTPPVANIPHIEEPIEEPVTPNGVSADISTDEKSKPQRSEKQLANDALVKALGLAYGAEASNGEYTNYLKIAQRLTKDISPEQFPEYVKFVRQMAIRDGWRFTINSLTSDKINPMSLFLAKDKVNPNQPKTREQIAKERLAQGLPYAY